MDNISNFLRPFLYFYGQPDPDFYIFILCQWISISRGNLQTATIVMQFGNKFANLINKLILPYDILQYIYIQMFHYLMYHIKWLWVPGIFFLLLERQ